MKSFETPSPKIFKYVGLLLLLVPIFVGCDSNENTHSAAVKDSTNPSSKVAADQSELAEKQYKSLRQNFRNDYHKLKQKIMAAEDAPLQQQKIFNDQDPLPQYIDDLVQLSKTFHQTSVAVSATLEAISRSKGEQKDQLMKYLIQTFPNKLNYGAIARSLYNDPPSNEIENWLKLMIENAPAGKDRATAILGFTTYIKNLPEYKRAFINNPHLMAKLPAKQQDYLRSLRTKRQDSEVIAYWREVIADYAGLDYGRGMTFDAVAKADMYEYQNLAIGKPAPELSGKDLDGIDFSLSDYSGKIIMLDFWGHWCGPCRQMYPEERELVQRLAGVPFVLIGMNSDHSLEFARDAVQSEGLSWRHFWNGPQGTKGPIAEAWNIDAWPTVYLIDGDGVIRYKDVLGKDLMEAIEHLLAESGHTVDLSDLN